VHAEVAAISAVRWILSARFGVASNGDR